MHLQNDLRSVIDSLLAKPLNIGSVTTLEQIHDDMGGMLPVATDAEVLERAKVCLDEAVELKDTQVIAAATTVLEIAQSVMMGKKTVKKSTKKVDKKSTPPPPKA